MGNKCLVRTLMRLQTHSLIGNWTLRFHLPELTFKCASQITLFCSVIFSDFARTDSRVPTEKLTRRLVAFHFGRFRCMYVSDLDMGLGGCHTYSHGHFVVPLGAPLQTSSSLLGHECRWSWCPPGLRNGVTVSRRSKPMHLKAEKSASSGSESSELEISD